MSMERPDPFKGPVVTYGRATVVDGAAPRAVLGGEGPVVLSLKDLAEVAAWAEATTRAALALASEAALSGFPGGAVRVFPGPDGTSLAINASRETDLGTLALAFFDEERPVEPVLVLSDEEEAEVIDFQKMRQRVDLDG